jgi:hypothetical protein
LIFTSETGAPLDPENFSRSFAISCDGSLRWLPTWLPLAQKAPAGNG